MILSHDQQTGAPRMFRIGEKDFPVSGLTPYQIGQLEAWLKDVIPSPLAEFRVVVADGGFTPPERMELLRVAQSKMEPQYDPEGFQVGGWPITFNSRQGQAMLFGGIGISHFLWVILSKHTPSFTKDSAAEMAKLMTVADLTRLSELIAVINPLPEDGDIKPPDPHRTDLPVGYTDPNG